MCSMESTTHVICIWIAAIGCDVRGPASQGQMGGHSYAGWMATWSRGRAVGLSTMLRCCTESSFILSLGAPFGSSPGVIFERNRSHWAPTTCVQTSTPQHMHTYTAQTCRLDVGEVALEKRSCHDSRIHVIMTGVPWFLRICFLDFMDFCWRGKVCELYIPTTCFHIQSISICQDVGRGFLPISLRWFSTQVQGFIPSGRTGFFETAQTAICCSILSPGVPVLAKWYLRYNLAILTSLQETVLS